jgi:sulfonate transport system permease protein
VIARRQQRPAPWRPVVMTGASLIAGLLLWSLASSVSPPRLFPPPWVVADQASKLLADGRLIEHATASLRRVLIGYLLGVGVAIPVGFVMGWYRTARVLLDPWIQFLRMIPALAFIPLVIVVVGIGEPAKIWVIFLGTFLAAVIAVYEGVRNVDRTIINAARVLGAGDRTIFLRVVVPASSPYVLVGARIALGNGFGTLIASELIAAPSGLGVMMQTASAYFDVPTIMVGIVSIGILGLSLDRVIRLVDRRVTSWQERRE